MLIISCKTSPVLDIKRDHVDTLIRVEDFGAIPNDDVDDTDALGSADGQKIFNK